MNFQPAVFDRMIQQNSGVIISPSEADKIAKWLINEGKDCFSVEEVAADLNLPHVVGLIYNPAFVRAASRLGAIFYIDSGLNIRKYVVKRSSQLLEPIVDSEPDPDFYLVPKWSKDLAKFFERDQTVLLIGPSGCGKTLAVEQVFKERRQELLVVSCNPSMSADDFEGTVHIKGGDTKFVPAAPTIASERGLGLLLDEADAVPAEACYSLYRLLNKKEMHIIRKGFDSCIARHPNLRIAGTQNTEGRGDPRGLHHGRFFQDEAFLDRWDNTIKVDYPDIDTETYIIRRQTGLPEKYAEQVSEVAQLLRQAMKEERIMFCMTMRRARIVASNLSYGYTPLKAWEFAVLNRTTDEDRQAIKEILQRVYGTRMNKRLN